MKTEILTAIALSKVLDELTAEIDRDLPITLAVVFFKVAEAGTEGTDQGTLQHALGISSSGMSRSLQTLGERHYLKRQPGLELVERVIDPMDNRRRVVRLTPKGAKLMARIGTASRSRA